ncbi:MAG: hypothetical protein AAF378_18160 [Cyanobacteria bacterium P01_A01_bin.84]
MISWWVIIPLAYISGVVVYYKSKKGILKSKSSHSYSTQELPEGMPRGTSELVWTAKLRKVTLRQSLMLSWFGVLYLTFLDVFFPSEEEEGRRVSW